jgi:flavin reductase (DIM6/NTAB) family NADH-FMN oxidoreductase RutF
MEQTDAFTVSVPRAGELKKELAFCGTRSGRDEDKLSRTRITPQASQVVSAPSFAEAELVIECKKVYWVDLDRNHFLDPSIERNYPAHDYHRMYYGEMLVVRAEPKFIGA